MSRKRNNDDGQYGLDGPPAAKKAKLAPVAAVPPAFKYGYLKHENMYYCKSRAVMIYYKALPIPKLTIMHLRRDTSRRWIVQNPVRLLAVYARRGSVRITDDSLVWSRSSHNYGTNTLVSVTSTSICIFHDKMCTIWMSIGAGFKLFRFVVAIKRAAKRKIKGKRAILLEPHLGKDVAGLVASMLPSCG